MDDIVIEDDEIVIEDDEIMEIETTPVDTEPASPKKSPVVEKKSSIKPVSQKTPKPTTARKSAWTDAEEELIEIVEEELATPAKVSAKAIPTAAKKTSVAKSHKAAAPKSPIVSPRKSLPAWTSRQKAKAFASFLACGFIPVQEKLKRYARVLAGADPVTTVNVKGQDVIIQGIHDPGRMLAVFRISSNACVADFVGMLTVKGSSGDNASVAEVIQASAGISGTDILYPLDLLRREFEDQVTQAERKRGHGSVSVRVKCISRGRNIIDSMNDVLVLDKGRQDGVSLGWTFAISVPDQDAIVTRGRVVRLERSASFVKITKLRQPVSVGDRGRLDAN